MGSFELNNNIRRRQAAQGMDPDSMEAEYARHVEMFGHQDLVYGVAQTVFGEDGNCLRAAVATIVGLLIFKVVDVLDGQEPEEMWFERLTRWAAANGWVIECVAPSQPPKGLAIASGPTSRATQTHAVVVDSGRPVWDPHPSNAFLTSVGYYISFERFRPSLPILHSETNKDRNGQEERP